eukprot:TRINITY_DN9957_c0_g1_i1.p1 TRINITY_DN9957_c0_g1~~TRINITY_DN9957_c0_g1_i1.p1  ORF type:complete len:386 (+),score=76.18 TRINITY_DN9957_c0_g1_i1:44-1201(+)
MKTAMLVLLMSVFLDARQLYVAEKDGLKIIDVSNTRFPTLRGGGHPAEEEGPLSVYEDEGLVYVMQTDKVEILKTTEGSLVRVGTCPGVRGGKGIVVRKRMVYLTSEEGLQICNATDPATAKMVGSLGGAKGHLRGLSWGVAVQHDLAYVADWGHGLTIVNVTNTASPVLVAELETPGNPSDVSVVGGYAYVAELDGMCVVDVHDPANPRVVGAFNTGGGAYVVKAAKGTAYVGDRHAVHIVDVRDANHPALAASYETSGAVTSLHVRMDHGRTVLFAGTRGHVHVIDVSKPKMPFLLGTTLEPPARPQVGDLHKLRETLRILSTRHTMTRVDPVPEQAYWWRVCVFSLLSFFVFEAAVILRAWSSASPTTPTLQKDVPCSFEVL